VGAGAVVDPGATVEPGARVPPAERVGAPAEPAPAPLEDS
jgi:hypothetical protein